MLHLEWLWQQAGRCRGSVHHNHKWPSHPHVFWNIAVSAFLHSVTGSELLGVGSRHLHLEIVPLVVLARALVGECREQ